MLTNTPFTDVYGINHTDAVLVVTNYFYNTSNQASYDHNGNNTNTNNGETLTYDVSYWHDQEAYDNQKQALYLHSQSVNLDAYSLEGKEPIDVCYEHLANFVS